MIKKFIELAEKYEYIKLPEKPLVRNESQETFFIGSSIMANMNLFEENHQTPAKYYTVQRVFSSTRLDDIGIYPLAASFEVMLSIFRFMDESVYPSVEFIIEYLKESLHIDPNNLLFLAPYELGIREALISMGINKKNIISWNKSLPLKLGNNIQQGYYLKLFMKYKHGIIPCATLGYVRRNNKLDVDSALFLERLSFVSKNRNHIYDDIFFIDTINEINNSNVLKNLDNTKKYLWANHIRSLLILLNDGLVASGKGKGHIINKITRKLASTIYEKSISEIDLHPIIQSSLIGISRLNYQLSLDIDKTTKYLSNIIDSFCKQIRITSKDFENWLMEEKDISINDIKKWKTERGLFYEIMLNIANRHSKVIETPLKEDKFWFRNACYSFDVSEIIADPIEFIKDSEEKRMRGVKL